MLRRIAIYPLLVLAVTLATAASVQADEIADYNRTVDAYNADLSQYDSAAAAFNSERESFNHAVDQYNALRPEERTQFQHDRLDRWYDELAQRLAKLDAIYAGLEIRKAELDRWSWEIDNR